MTAVLVAALVAGVPLGLWAMQRRLIYLPAQQVPSVGETLPGWQEVVLPTSDGLDLAAWFRAPEAGRPVVIVFTGNAGNRAGRVPLGAALAAGGHGVLLVDYRGYGGNPGSPSEEGLALDARAARTFVAEAGYPVVYLGESLGAAVAIELAVEYPPSALVIRSGWTSLADVARTHYPLIPVKTLLRDEYPSIDRIGQVEAPVFVILGDRDSIVPPSQTRALYDAAKQPKELLEIEGADHNDYVLLAGEEMIGPLLRFLD